MSRTARSGEPAQPGKPGRGPDESAVAVAVVGSLTVAHLASGRTLAEPRLSPAGGEVAFLARAGGTTALVVVPAAGGPEEVLTTQPAPRGAWPFGGGVHAWTPGGEGLVYVAGTGGLWFQPRAGGPARLVVEGDGLGSPAVSPDGSWVAYTVDDRAVAVAPLDPAGVVGRASGLPGAPAWPVRVDDGDDFAFDPGWSPDGTRLVWHAWNVPDMAWDTSGLRSVTLDTSVRRGVVVVKDGPERVETPGVAVGQPRFAPGGALGYTSDAGGWANVVRASTWRGAPEPVWADEAEHAEPTWGPGQRSWCWSPDGTAVAVARNDRGLGSLWLVPLGAGTPRKVADGVHGGLSWVDDRLVALVSGPRRPTAIVAYDVGGGTTQPADTGTTGSAAGTAATGRVLARGPVALPAEHFVEPEPVTWPAADGATVHGRLYRPHGDDVRPPLVLWVHGGPNHQSPSTFWPLVERFCQRGWAVLVADPRGSSGFGRAWLQALRGRWGEVDVDDLLAGVDAAVAQGWCDPQRVVAMGGSSGGFAVLHLLARAPERFAAGVVRYPVVDLVAAATATHRFEAHSFDGLLGALPGAWPTWVERSPLTHAEAIRAPLLLLAGRDDPVVPVEQSEALAARLQRGGGVADLVVYEGEGHGWRQPATVLDEARRIDAFLARHVLHVAGDGPAPPAQGEEGAR